MIPHDPRRRRKRLHDIQQVMDSLRDPVEAPDLTSAILGRVHTQRPFLSDRVRKFLWVGRALAASIVIGAALGVALTHRHAPELVRTLSPSSAAAPLSALADTFGAEAAGVRIAPFKPFRFPDFTPDAPRIVLVDAPRSDREDDPAPGFVLAFYSEPESASPTPVYAMGVATSLDARAGYIGGARRTAHLEPSFARAALTLTVPGAPPMRADRNLLDDLSPVITGEPAGENLSPR